MEKEILEKFPRLLHGGDYNPEQWISHPEILDEDIQLMKEAAVNVVTVGIFSWCMLEPIEGDYQLSYMEKIIDKLFENGIYVILSTPTAAMPQWLVQQYPEVLQTNEDRVQNLSGGRHNFCYSSPIMQKKTQMINEKLSEKFGNHPAVILWHISNEYGNNGGDASCHCSLCQEEFRKWLKEKYQTLEALNAAWWTSFWSHTYTQWEQIEFPNTKSMNVLKGKNIDWKRFVSYKLQRFCNEEIEAVKIHSKVPVTTNMMSYFKPLDYDKWAEEINIVSWDSYPDWHSREDETEPAVWAAAMHDKMRSLKKAPFLLMESSPSVISWREENSVKRPGMHFLSSMQAIAHGSQSVQYFQWRKSRGASEQFHGAVVGHDGRKNTRTFAEVSKLGNALQKISDKIYDTCNKSEVAIIFDWENWWALEDADGPYHKMNYVETILKYYRPFWEKGIGIDLISMDHALDDYKLVLAPLCYMYKCGYPEKIKKYVQQGGNYVGTYWSGLIDENGLCFLGNQPLEDVFGISVEEIDMASNYFPNSIQYKGVEYPLGGLRERLHTSTAETICTYTEDYIKGTPAITKNIYGNGNAFYIAAMQNDDFLSVITDTLIAETGIKPVIETYIPYGVSVVRREGVQDIYFFMNFNREAASLDINDEYVDLLTDELVRDNLSLGTYECKILIKQ